MDKAGHWSLSPAYDMTYAYNPRGEFTNSHQMMVNRKRDLSNRASGLSQPPAPFCKRSYPEIPVVLGSNQMTAQIEKVTDSGMGAQKSLCLPD